MIKVLRKGKKIMKRISTGIENFKELLDNNYYYVDKTKLIEDVLSDKVTLYTRPRRFGKTLNMSMLYYFFSNKEKENTYLFNNLKFSIPVLIRFIIFFPFLSTFIILIIT